MIEFPTHRDCTLCPLHTSCVSPGIPTRTFAPPSGKSTALLVVGEAPGHEEDKTGTSWSGWSGNLLASFINAMRLTDYADVYLANACRCRPPYGTSLTNGQINQCRSHLFSDISLLSSEYTRIVILSCGAPATFSITGKAKLTSAFSSPASPITTMRLYTAPKKMTAVPLPIPAVSFSTYHPAYLAPGRQPALVHAVEAHFSLVARYLEGTYTPPTLQYTAHLGGDPWFAEAPYDKTPSMLGPIALDIETYGILQGAQQTVFHPIKSMMVDNIPFERQIITVALALHDPVSGYHSFVYQWNKPSHRRQLYRWFEELSRTQRTILGQNIAFDLSYLSVCDPTLAYYIVPGRLTIDDTLLSSFLLYDQRPEKGLKELTNLFGMYDYNIHSVTGKTSVATGYDDPELHHYNSVDAINTLRLHDHNWATIRKTYGPSSPKFSPACTYMRQAALWDVIMLQLTGLTFSIPQLEKLEAHHTLLQDEAIERCQTHGITVKGTGSETSTRDFVTRVLTSLYLMDDPRLVLTEKTKKISIGVENFNLIFQSLSPDNPHYTAMSAIRDYHTNQKLLGTYITPLLHNTRKGIVHRASIGQNPVGFAYPSWYPCPTPLSKQQDGDTSGTVQARFSCKRPAAQTFPPPVMDTICSRFVGGKLLAYDMSQIELRIAALLSGDPLMLSEYRTGIDRHRVTGLTQLEAIYPVGTEPGIGQGWRTWEGDVWKAQNHPAYLWRQLGKCVTGDTLVSTEKGIMRIDKVIPNRTTGFTPAINPLRIWNGSAWVAPSHYYYNQLTPTIKITLQDGRQIEGTYCHPIMTTTGWKELKDISKSDIIPPCFNRMYDTLLPVSIPFNPFTFGRELNDQTTCSITITPEWGYLMGVIQGDGTINGESCSVVSSLTDIELHAELERCALVVGIPIKKRTTRPGRSGKRRNPLLIFQLGSRSVCRFLTQCGMYAGERKEMVVPPVILQSPLSVQAQYIKGLFDTDGTMSSAGAISLSSKDRPLLSGVQLQLLLWGIRTKIIEKYNKNYKKPYYTLQLNRENTLLYLTHVGVMLPRKRTLPTKEWTGISKWNPTNLDTVVSIEHKQAAVYDFTIPDGHCFWGNGILNHNTLNFLVLFLGGPEKYQETVHNDLGLAIPIEHCRASIYAFDRRYAPFREWQQSLIKTVKSKGYLELITGWSRSFATGKSAETYINEIANCPIQTIAAQLLQSAEDAINRELYQRRARSRIILQIHDALYFDVPAPEEPYIDELAKKYLTNPPLYPIIEQTLGRSVPLLYEKKILS